MKRVKTVWILIICILLNISFPNLRVYAEQTSLEKELRALPHVIEVTKEATNRFTEKYLVIFEVPVDWNNPDGATMPIRVVVSIRDKDGINVFGNGGYMLNILQIMMDIEQPLSTHLNCNCIEMEYRFFGESIPKGLDHDKADLYEYLTVENAAADQHEIYSELSQVLKGPWVSTGISKGGLNTLFYGYYYPDDMDALVPTVGPACVGTHDIRMVENLYTTIGDVKYGEEKSAELQKLIMDTNLLLLKYREDIEPLFIANCKKTGNVYDYTYYGADTDDIIFELALLEFNIQLWQNEHNFDALGNIKELLLTDAVGNAQKAANYMSKYAPGLDWARKCEFFSYYVQAFKELGNYRQDFSYIREAINKVTPSDAPRQLTITEDMEEDVFMNVLFTDEQKAAFTYDGTVMEGLKAWIQETDQKIMFIYGASDPWYGVRIDDVYGKENIKIYVDPNNTHNSTTLTLPAEQRKEALQILNEWLYGKGPDPEPDPKPDPEPEPKPDPKPLPVYHDDEEYHEYSSGTYESPKNGAVNVEWVVTSDGKWQAVLDGKVFTGGWLNAINPYAGKNQPQSSWFYFNGRGEMLTGWNWITEADGNKYCYYLNPKSDGTLGACFLNGRTPDGYYVNQKGQWIP